MGVKGTVNLEFDPTLLIVGEDKDKDLRDGLSAIALIERNLWLANDETLRLERLTLQSTDETGGPRYGDHTVFDLAEFLSLPGDPSDGFQEVDVEGLDVRDGYLWLVGSHSAVRQKIKKKDSLEKTLKKFSEPSRKGNRFLLARIPLKQQDGNYVLDKGGETRVPAQLPGTNTGNDLTDSVATDKFLRDFLAIPSKDNGFDIEGLAVSDKRVFVGLRGPVLRGWAIILELKVETDSQNPARLQLGKFSGAGGEGLRYRKHFLQLDGLGVRDLCVHGSDLLVLAGPTMELDGPVRIYRWKGGANPAGETVSFAEDLIAIDVPFGDDREQNHAGEKDKKKAGGKNHAEGMTMFFTDGGNDDSVLVVYDAAADSRRLGNGVKGDIIACPPA